jgi:hypothetical protein
LSVELLRPKGDLQKLAAKDCHLEVRDGAGSVVSRFDLPLNIENTRAAASVKIPDATKLTPGLYPVIARTTVNSLPLKHTSGFWIYDEALLSRGKPLTADKHFFYRDGEVFPVTGTTYMASDKHRRFLFEPNPWIWDGDFRAMKQAGVNMVRTGIWTAGRNTCLRPAR